MRHQKQLRNRITMMCLTILLIVGVIPPHQAHANLPPVAHNVNTNTDYSDLQSAINAASNGDTIGLLSDINLSIADNAIQYNSSNTTVTLDLYGYNLIRQAPPGMMDGGDGATIEIMAGTMNIQDSPSTTHPHPQGSIDLQNSYGGTGSAVNIHTDGTLNLKSGALLGTGQGIYADQVGAHFNISGGMVYGSANSVGSEAIAAVSGVYGTISGGYIGTKDPNAAMIWSASTLDAKYWNITGGYFTSNSFSDPSPNTIASFITSGSLITLNPPLTQPLSGSTQYVYQLSQLSKETTPTAALNPLTETLIGLVPNAKYTVNGNTYIADANGTIPLQTSWINSNLSIVKTGTANVSTDSSPQLLTIPARPAAPTVTANDTLDTIVGITSGMEYSIDGGSWTAYSPTNPPQLSGTHMVKVRYAASLQPVSLTSDATTLNFYPSTSHSVLGTVIELNGNASNSVVGANVQLYQGNTAVGAAVVTDTYGNFKLSGISNGAYNLVVTKAGRIATYIVIVNNGDYTFAQTIILPSGNTNTQVQINGSGTPNVAVGGLTSLLQDSLSFTLADQQLISNGGKVNITMDVQQQTAATAPGAAALQKLANGQTINLYLDLTLVKTTTTAANVSTTTTIPTVGNLLQIVVPYDSTSQSNVAVYRYHNGVAQWMSSLPYSTSGSSSEGFMVSPDRKQLIIWSQNFSTYAIAAGSQTVIGSGGGGGFTTGGGTATSTFAFTLAPSAGGTISPASLSTVLKGSNQTLTFTPDAGYSIQDVIIDGKSVGAVSTYTFTNVSAAHTVKVVFVKTAVTTPSSEGLPYYMDGNQKVFIGFATTINGTMKYIAPVGKEVLFQPNAYSFSDVNGGWAAAPVSFVADREIFLGTGDGKFAPNKGMTRAMFAAVMGRLYERSYGTLSTSGASQFKDVSASSWYGT
ncbi:DUF4073 domain-containing protein, partial [Paenibacillus sp. SGZ-1009]|uniref:DUF4073 domain-containing protein n=1 Tax=Paenibacillus campi TaxID=3106031 RepID=UPI002AFEBBC9